MGFERKKVYQAKFKTGTVVKFSNLKGYGFIRPDVGSNGIQRADVFAHRSHIFSSTKIPTLRVGQKVEFEVTMDVRTNKPMAIHISGPNRSALPSEKENVDEVQNNNNHTKIQIVNNTKRTNTVRHQIPLNLTRSALSSLSEKKIKNLQNKQFKSCGNLLFGASLQQKGEEGVCRQAVVDEPGANKENQFDNDIAKLTSNIKKTSLELQQRLNSVNKYNQFIPQSRPPLIHKNSAKSDNVLSRVAQQVYPIYGTKSEKVNINKKFLN
eukprot:UN23728